MSKFCSFNQIWLLNLFDIPNVFQDNFLANTEAEICQTI